MYLINASYEKESLGIDMEDQIVDKYYKEIQGRKIEITEYEVPERNNSRFAEDRKGNGSWREKVLWCRIYGTVGNRYVPYCGV